MEAPTTPLKWSSKKSTSSSSYHLKSPTAHRTPGGGGSQHSSNGGARSIRSNGGTAAGNGRMNAVFCDVVVEGAERNADGWDLPPEIMSFLPTLGTTLVKPTSSPAFPTTPSRAGLDELASHVDRPPDIERRRNLLLELLKTEETYVKRLNILYKLYAHPLRDFTRRKDTEIINAFEAKQIFGNIEAILPANEALLADLRQSLYGNHEGKTFEHWASVMVRHLEHFQTIYPAYILNLERAKDLERDLRRRNTVFRNFIERTRASAGASTDNCSLESLLIEPAQRIPRYRLLLKGIVREVEKEDKFRDVMLNAIELASSIAALDEDEETRRAAALFGLGRSIEGLPPRITNSHRYFVDCIDVFDRPISSSKAENLPGNGYAAHQEELLCTLFLFNDRLIVAKRESAQGTGRALAGLDNINKLVKDMQMPDPALSRSKSPSKKKAKSMRYRGEFDLGDLVAKDDDEIGFSLFLEKPPKEFSDRWNGRSVRKYQILKPETPSDKARFLSNIWNCIALVKGGRNHSTARLWSNGTLSTYWNIYDKRSYLSESRYAKIALQVVAGDEAPIDLPFGFPGPHAVATAYFHPDGSCDYCLRLRGNNSEPTYIHTTPAKLVGAILHAARQLQLYSVPPSIPGLETMPLQREESRASSSSRPMSASSSGRPRSVIDFMRSPGGSMNSSPRRTLSKASKTSTVDSRQAASIFSGDYASTAQTSAMSQDGHGSPYKRPLSSLSRPPTSAPGSAPQHIRQNSESSRYFRATSAEPEHIPVTTAQNEAFARPPQRPQSAMANIKHEDTEESLNLSTDDAYDPNALARSRSDGALYKTSSSQSISRSRCGTVSRSASTQSMRIEEEEEEAEEEEEVLHSVPSRTPERALSPPMQRNGTISRPMGPRQLGSRSPAASPQPLPIASSRVVSRSRTPSPLDDDPFMPLSHRKKRFYESEANDDDSFSSKRGLRELQDGSTEVYSKSTTPDQSDRYRDANGPTAEKRDHTSRVRSTAEFDSPKELHRTGSLPRSPNTRSLYQRSRGVVESISAKPSPLTKAAVASRTNRIPRKTPAADDFSDEDIENITPLDMEVDLLRKQSIEDRQKYAEDTRSLKEQVASLQKALQSSEAQLKATEKKLKADRQDIDAEMDAFMNEAIQMANERIERETASRDTKIAALEAEVKKLKNENRALQALLRKQRE